MEARIDAGNTKEEVQEAMEGIKAGKAPGLAAVAPEGLTRGGVTVAKWLVTTISEFCVRHSAG